MGRRRANPQRGLLGFLAVGVGAGIFALTVLVAVISVLIPLAIGATPMTVLTSSMIPTYPPGTLVIVVPVAPEKMRIGDAITYQLASGRPEVVTHRVVAIGHHSNGTASFTLKGDNNGAADATPVAPAQVRGAVAYSIPWLGYLNTFFGGSARTWIVPAVAGGLFVYAGFTITSATVTALARRRRAG